MKILASLFLAGVGVAYSQTSELTYLDATSSVQTQLNNKVGTGTTVNGHPLSNNVVVSASDLTTGTLPSGQIPPPGVSNLGGVLAKDCSAGGQFLQKINTDGTETCATAAGGGNVSGPGTVTNGYLPQWGASNNLLTVGLPVSTVAAANTVPESGAGGTLAAGWLPAGGSHTINTTAPLNGGGAVALGGTLTLACPTCLTTNAVPSVFGRTGAITAQSGDYSAAQISGLAASATTDTTNAANIVSGTLAAGRLPAPGAAALGGVQSKDCSAGGQFLQKINTDGTETCASPSGGGGSSGGLDSYAASQTLGASNAGHLVVATGSSAMTLTLPSPPSSSTLSFTILNLNTNSAGLSISRNGLSINGGTTDFTGGRALLPGQSVFFSTDGSNYFARFPDSPGTGLKYVCAATGCTWTPDSAVVMTQAQGQTMAPNVCTVTWAGAQGLCGGASGMIPPPTAYLDANGYPLTISINAASACPASAQVNVGLGYKSLLRPDGVSNTVAGDCLAGVPVLASYNPNALSGSGAFVLSALPRRTADTYRYCSIAVGDESSSAITNVQLGPQVHLCKIPAAATLVEIDVDADAGSPSVIVGRRRCTAFTSGTCSGETVVNLLSSALAVSSGFEKCANSGGTTGIDGSTTCSAMLQNTSLNAGDWIELVSGTAGGTAKLFEAHVVYTVN